jgi:nucleotide-binding universal stress UspA family protein
MYSKIMIPIDLAHAERLDKAITTAIDIARMYTIPICMVGVTAETPTGVAHSPNEFEQKLEAYGAEQASKHGIAIETATHASHDPAIDLDKRLIDAATKSGADLIVMASHVPGMPEHIFASNAGAVASHAGVSVFVVR